MKHTVLLQRLSRFGHALVCEPPDTCLERGKADQNQYYQRRKQALHPETPCRVSSVTGNQGADTLISKDLQQTRVGDPAVDNMRRPHAVLYRAQGTPDLGQHAAVNGAVFYQIVDL